MVVVNVFFYGERDSERKNQLTKLYIFFLCKSPSTYIKRAAHLYKYGMPLAMKFILVSFFAVFTVNIIIIIVSVRLSVEEEVQIDTHYTDWALSKSVHLIQSDRVVPQLRCDLRGVEELRVQKTVTII